MERNAPISSHRAKLVQPIPNVQRGTVLTVTVVTADAAAHVKAVPTHPQGGATERALM